MHTCGAARKPDDPVVGGRVSDHSGWPRLNSARPRIDPVDAVDISRQPDDSAGAHDISHDASSQAAEQSGLILVDRAQEAGTCGGRHLGRGAARIRLTELYVGPVPVASLCGRCTSHQGCCGTNPGGRTEHQRPSTELSSGLVLFFTRAG